MVSSVPVAQQAMMILMMSLFSRTSVCFSVAMPQSAPECTSEHPRVNNVWAVVFTASPNDIAPPPQMEKVMYGPALITISDPLATSSGHHWLQKCRDFVM